MSAFWDSVSGAGYTGDSGAADGVGDAGVSGYSTYSDAAQAAGAGTYTTDSGAMQMAAAQALGFLGKLADIELYKRAAQATVQPQLRTTQNGIGISQRSATVGGITTTSTTLDGLLPLLLLGGAAVLLLRS